MPLIDRDGNEVKWNLMERFKSNLLPLPERVTGEAAGTYLKRRESWIQLKADMKRLIHKEGKQGSQQILLLKKHRKQKIHMK